MNEASFQNRKPTERGNGWVGRKTGGEPVPIETMGTRGSRGSGHQRTEMPARAVRQSPHGVKSDPKAVQGLLSEPGTQTTASLGMAKATGERDGLARSPHGSQRTGKPSTRRRGTVDTGSKQEGDGEPSVSVNTGAILDMQRKLYGWSRSEPSKVFSDLFNLVCGGTRISNGWNDELDGVSFYPEAANPISGFTWLGVTLQ